MTPDQTNIKCVLMREGAEAIYKEGPFVAHVKLHNIRASENKMEADVTLLKVFGTRTPETSVPEQWKIGTNSIGGFQEAWSAAYSGWEIFFDAGLIKAVLEYSDELPESDTANNRWKKVRTFIMDFNDALTGFQVSNVRSEKGENNFTDELKAGEQSLVAKFGPTTELNWLSLDWSLNSGFEDIEDSGQKHKIPIATPEQVSFMEKWIRARCAPYEEHIGEMSPEELEAFQWDHFMFQDFNRGKMPGQVIPPRVFQHSVEFERWEESIFGKIADRSNELNID